MKNGFPPVRRSMYAARRVRRRIDAEPILEHLGDGIGVEGTQAELAVARARGPLRPVRRPVVEQEQRSRIGNGVDQAFEERLAALVEPLHVLDQHEGRAAIRACAHEVAQDAVQPPHPRVRVELWERQIGVGHAEKVEHEGEVVSERFVQEQKAARDLLARRDRTVELVDAEVAAQELQHGKEGERAAVGESVRLEDLDPGRAHALDELVAQPALADAGFTDDADDLSTPGFGRLERLFEHRDLLAASDEARQPARARDVEALAGARPRRSAGGRGPAPERP